MGVISPEISSFHCQPSVAGDNPRSESLIISSIMIPLGEFARGAIFAPSLDLVGTCLLDTDSSDRSPLGSLDTHASTLL